MSKNSFILLMGLLMALSAGPLTAKPETFKVDPVHSMIYFRVKHMNVSYTYGMFFGPEGTLVVDEDNPANSSVTLQVQAENINTGNPNRDNHVRGPDFLNTRQFRTISFKSTAVKKTEDNQIEVKGIMNLHGVEKEITALFTEVGRGQMRGQTKIGFEGTFSLKRSDFGMTNMIGAVGDEINFKVTVEATLQEGGA